MRTARAPQFKYRAFLSYRSVDARQAEWLHRKLEAYVVPRSLVGTRGDYGVIPRRLGRIYRDRDGARAAERIERVIAEELSESQHLIVPVYAGRRCARVVGATRDCPLP